MRPRTIALTAALLPLQHVRMAELDALIDAVLGDAVAVRRDLHRHPEVGLDLPRTQERVLDGLDDLGLDLQVGDALSSVTGLLAGDRPGPTVLLRGDMDALPLLEETGLPYASTVDGAMHACGHDAHTAMLLAAARVLASRRRDLAGQVLFMFQPGEEGHGGARHMLDEGLLDPSRVGVVERAFAVHQTPRYPLGTIATRPGQMLASNDEFRVEVVGRGGHGALPHSANDPIPVACEMVQAIQTGITRRIDVFDPAVVSVTRIVAGSASNVIPATAEIRGTIRAVSERTRTRVKAMLQRIAEGVAHAHEMSASVEHTDVYPVTVTDATETNWVLDLARDIVGDQQVVTMPTPVMSSEDFSYVLNAVPGSFVFVGSCPPGTRLEDAASNHSNKMVIDEDAMVVGIRLYAEVALRSLAPA